MPAADAPLGHASAYSAEHALYMKRIRDFDNLWGDMVTNLPGSAEGLEPTHGYEVIWGNL